MKKGGQKDRPGFQLHVVVPVIEDAYLSKTSIIKAPTIMPMEKITNSYICSLSNNC